MASPMIPPASAPEFLAKHGWGGAEIRPLAGDASFRRYFRVHRGGETAVLMDAPPEYEDIGPFLTVAGHLLDRGFAPPRPLAVDRELGLLLLEDFGDERVGPVLQREPKRERQIYRKAVDILARLAAEPAPADLPRYDDAAMAREVSLFTDWYVPTVGLEVDEAGFVPAWREAWADVLREARRAPVMVLRDFHADNLMVLPGRDELGLLDFQDALAGHPAYDLVSLLQDARREIAPDFEEAMIERYNGAAGVADTDRFRAHYEILGAQRNTKILGIFTRLWKRDGKEAYLQLQPRVWGYLERNLTHPALAPVRAWFDKNIAPEMRAGAWLQGAVTVQRQTNQEIAALEEKLIPASDRHVSLTHNAPELDRALDKLEEQLPHLGRLNDPEMVEAAVHVETGLELLRRCRERAVQTTVRVIRHLIIEPLKRALQSTLDDAWKLAIQGALTALLLFIGNQLGVL